MRHPDTDILQTSRGIAHRIELSAHIQSALGGDFLPSLGHQANILGPHLQRDLQHFRYHGTFQIHSRGDHLTQGEHIRILNMPPILAQMQRDQIRPCCLSH